MKAIDISKLQMIVRHKFTQIDRDKNVMFVYFSLEPKFGATLNAQMKEISQDVYWVVAKDNTPDMWNELKDASNTKLVETFCEYASSYLDAKFTYEETKGDDFGSRLAVVTHDEKLGDNVNVYEDEEPIRFQQIIDEKGYQPISIPNPNPYSTVINSRERAYSLGTMISDNEEKQFLAWMFDVLTKADLPLPVIEI